MKPHGTKVVVCDPRKNALLKAGNKSDRIDARKLADLLRTGLLSTVYHGEHGVRPLKELARSYLALTQDLARVMNRLKPLYRSRAIPCAGERVYSQRHRAEWLVQLAEAGALRRAEFCYQQLEALQALRQQVRRDLRCANRRRLPVILVHPSCLFRAGNARIPNQRDASWRADLSRGARGPNRK